MNDVRTYQVDTKRLRLTLNKGTKDLSFNVWRDCCRLSWSSIDYGDSMMFVFASEEKMRQAEQVLRGALFVPSNNG
jgi:hypothetical protein